MSTLYIITNTVGDNVISILPGALNGPGGTVVDSDLRLYGQGTTLYGEGVNENLYRITESFACPEKAGSPGVPQDETDLGTGNGINNPLTGQPWYNTTTGKLLIYDATAAGFISPSAPAFGGTEPSAPLEGDLWFDNGDVNPLNHQLKVYDGTAFVSVADRYVTLDGTSTMYGGLVIEKVSPTVTIRSTDTTDAHVIFQDSGNNSRASVVGDIIAGTLALRVHDGAGAVTESVVMGTDGNISTTAVAPTANADLTRKDYVDNNFVADIGGTMSGKLTNNNEIEVNGILDINGTSDFSGTATFNDDVNLTSGATLGVPGMTLGLGGGSVTVGSDISFNAAGLIVSDTDMYINVDSANVGTGGFLFGKGGNGTTTGRTALFTINNNGRIDANTASYESLVTTNNTLTNKKYVDDEIAAATGGLGGVVPETFVQGTTPGGKDGDIWINGSVIYIKAAGTWRKVFPAQYT